MKHPLACLTALTLSLASAPTWALSPGDFTGKPSEFRHGSHNGAYVWEDDNGLHVRFTTDGSLHGYSGKVCAKEKVAALVPYQLEAGDRTWIGPVGKCVWFKFQTKGLLDGMDFKASGDVVIFDFKIDGQQLPAAAVRIGKGNRRPEHSPFALRR